MLRTLIKALATFAVSFVMGMLGFILGVIIFVGASEYLLAMENQFIAKILGFFALYGAAIVGGIFGLQKGARWTRLVEA